MDTDISGWILEFLLRQTSLDDQILKTLSHVLPIPNNNSRLNKTLILQKLKSDITKGTITERTIELLEQIKEMELTESNYEVSKAMKAAYSAVAMHCTAKLIDESTGDTKENYVSAVKRIWSDRVRELEKIEFKVGLIEGNVLDLVHEVESGTVDLKVCENVLEMYKGVDVKEVVLRYLNEAIEKLGPSFIESACEAVLSDDGLRKAMGLDECVKLNDQSKGSEASSAQVPPENKQVFPRCTGRSRHRTHRGAKIVDPMETTHNKYNIISTPEVNKIQEALETSALELNAAVTDPLPDALRLADSLKASTGENMARVAPGLSHDNKGKAPAADENDGLCDNHNKRLKLSLMERNRTAHTVEWSDSIDTSQEGSPRPHLNSPKAVAVSPLNTYKMKKFAMRRQKKRWTNLEEDTLRAAVQKHGKGNWKMILNLHRDIFVDRTEVDLKDKWRNLTS